MELVVHAFQTRVLHVGVDLGRLNARVSEHLLDLPEVRAAGQQVGGKTVATGITTLLINRDAFKFTILITPTPANRLSSFVVCVAKVTKLSS